MTKNILITGATSALGEELAAKAKSRYAGQLRLFIASRSHSPQLQRLTDNNTVYRSGIDLLEIKSELREEIQDFFTEPFTLIHTAGDFWLHERFLEFSTEKAKSMMDSHFLTLYETLQNILPLMVKRGGGRIITFSCNATDQCLPRMLPFTAAKAAVDATIKCIAHEFAKYNIVANSLALSSLRTKQNRVSKPHGDFEHYIDLSELSNTVFEFSDLSNQLVNGNVIKCYEYSDSFYGQGYFERIAQD